MSAADRTAPPLVLASSSPRRAALLSMLGLDFEILPADVDERLLAGEAPAVAAERLARSKAATVAAARPDALIVGSDTMVVVDGTVLGKPTSAGEAVEMLLMLQGREHQVVTGLAILGPDGASASAVEVASVRFREFGRDVAEYYAATGEPMDKAGAYGIQGYGAVLVKTVHGDFFAVMGLPVARLVELFASLGWSYDFNGLTEMAP